MAQRRKARLASRAQPSPQLARLWAPWRSGYIRRAGNPGGCIFCFGELSAAERRRRLVLYADPTATVMLNRYPYNNGHLMIAPRRHLASPELLSAAERTALSELLARTVARLRRALKPAGFNLGANLGRAAGAGFVDHMHWHVVPRWEGDANFMTTLASARVISQHLEESFTTLAPFFKTIGASLS
jgi:ATP adenylyltransferase